MKKSGTTVLAWLVVLAIIRVVAGLNVPKLLLISLDGFRYDYLDRHGMSNFKRFYDEGVRARWLGSAFITKTLLNHYGSVTGLRPEYHGITGNFVYDSASGEYWDGSTCAPKAPCDRWFKGEPIWLTNHNRDSFQASHRRTGSLYWIGAGALIQNYTAEKSLPFPSDETSVNFSASLETMLSWFTDSIAPINLGLMYHPEPDATGHTSGPESEEMDRALHQLDADFGVFLNKVEAHANLSKSLNIIVISDHGMAEVFGSVNLTACLPSMPEYFIIPHNNPIYGVWLNSSVPHSKIDHLAVAAGIKKRFSGDPSCAKVGVYTNATMPYHYSSSLSSRIAPIVLEAPPGYLFDRDITSLPKGNHGWNNSWEKMRGIFIARGPSFKKGYVSDGFDNVHLYELFCQVLSVPPAPNNGSLDVVRHLLVESHDGAQLSSQTKIAIALAVIVGMLLIGTVAVAIYRCRLSAAAIMNGRAAFSTSNAELLIDDEEDADHVHAETPLVG